MGVSIDDIAKEANVSKMTVSRVINNAQYVSEKTRAKVLKIIKKRNYTANLLAQHLSKNKSLNIAGLITNIEVMNHQMLKLINSIEQAFEQNGHSLFIFNLPKSHTEKEIDILNMYFKNNILKGFILLGDACDESTINQLNKHKVQGIIVGNKSNSKKFGNITLDYKKAICKSVAFLKQNRHTHIGFLHDKDILSPHLNILEKTMQRPLFKIPTASTLPKLKKMLQSKNKPTALISMHPYLTQQVYIIADELNLTIPTDISIIEITSFANKTTSSFSLLPEEITQQLSEHFINSDLTAKIVLSPHLFKNHSVIKRQLL